MIVFVVVVVLVVVVVVVVCYDASSIYMGVNLFNLALRMYIKCFQRSMKPILLMLWFARYLPAML